MVSPNNSIVEGSGTTQGSMDSGYYCNIEEIMLIEAVVGADNGKDPKIEEYLRSPTPTLS